MSKRFSGFKDSLLRSQQENLCYEWDYFLQVESTVWFKYLCHKLDKKTATKKARKYVDKIRNNNIPPLPPSASLEVSIPSYTYCTWHADCLFLKNDDDKNSSSLIFPPLTPSLIRGKGRKHGNHKKQNSLTEKTKDIKDKDDKNNSSPLFTPSLRRDRDKKHRSGICIPRIFCEKKVPQKICNERLCNWYVENERIILEKDGWIAVSQQDDVCEILICPHPAPGNSAMFGKTGNPKQYSIQNCVELESKYLLSSEMGNVLQDIEIIKDDVKTIKNDINNLTSAINNLTEAIKAKS
ncbi:4594_t:CDS:2 [Funneliformis caledonium]|uniref:4594_t:CDS:1 n=1 Tax=Funneliformis caledonium TaxID=1117310 RepID=A0A9N8WFY2_9GLOM|nr:4594_t:CDS:2 [Funneliformis caledonium]